MVERDPEITGKERPRIVAAVDSDFVRLIDEAASLTGFSRSEFIRMALREKLEDISMLSKLAKQEIGEIDRNERETE